MTKKTERRGRKKVASRDLKKNVTIRLKDSTRDILEDDFIKVQRAIDYLCAQHIKQRDNVKYMSKIKDFLSIIQEI
jgi:hypothetical protein